MVVPVLLFILGLLMLIKGGDWFVEGASGIAHKFRIPEILIGATVVSIGTTLPEVMVSATSAATGHGEMAYGNAIGSIICNTALISAVTIAVRPAKVDRKSMIVPVLFFFSAAAFYSAIAYTTGYFYRWVGIVLLLIFALYMFINIRQAFKTTELSNETIDEIEEKNNPLYKDIIFLVLGAALIAFGADFLVDNGIIIAEKLGVPETVIAITFIALGTSLPELVTAVTSLIKGHGALSLGNIIGANIFNLVLVSGMATTISPFKVPAESTINGINSSLVLDIPLMLGVMLLLTLPSLIKGKLYRYQGILLLIIYAAFVTIQFMIQG